MFRQLTSYTSFAKGQASAHQIDVTNDPIGDVRNATEECLAFCRIMAKEIQTLISSRPHLILSSSKSRDISNMLQNANTLTNEPLRTASTAYLKIVESLNTMSSNSEYNQKLHDSLLDMTSLKEACERILREFSARQKIYKQIVVNYQKIFHEEVPPDLLWDEHLPGVPTTKDDSPKSNKKRDSDKRHHALLESALHNFKIASEKISYNFQFNLQDRKQKFSVALQLFMSIQMEDHNLPENVIPLYSLSRRSSVESMAVASPRRTPEFPYPPTNQIENSSTRQQPNMHVEHHWLGTRRASTNRNDPTPLPPPPAPPKNSQGKMQLRVQASNYDTCSTSSPKEDEDGYKTKKQRNLANDSMEGADEFLGIIATYRTPRINDRSPRKNFNLDE